MNIHITNLAQSVLNMNVNTLGRNKEKQNITVIILTFFLPLFFGVFLFALRKRTSGERFIPRARFTEN